MSWPQPTANGRPVSTRKKKRRKGAQGLTVRQSEDFPSLRTVLGVLKGRNQVFSLYASHKTEESQAYKTTLIPDLEEVLA